MKLCWCWKNGLAVCIAGFSRFPRRIPGEGKLISCLSQQRPDVFIVPRVACFQEVWKSQEKGGFWGKTNIKKSRLNSKRATCLETHKVQSGFDCPRPSQSGCSSGSLRVQARRVPQMTQKHPKFWCLSDHRFLQLGGPSGNSRCVQNDTTRHKQTAGIGNDTCQEALSVFQSEVMEERRDGIRLTGGAEESRGALTSTGVCIKQWGSFLEIPRLVPPDDGWWVLICVKHVVITHVGHESAPCGAAPLTDH